MEMLYVKRMLYKREVKMIKINLQTWRTSVWLSLGEYLNICEYFSWRDWNKHHIEIIDAIVCENLEKESYYK